MIDERDADAGPAHFDTLGHMPPFPYRTHRFLRAQSAYCARREYRRETGRRTGSSPPPTAAASVGPRWTWCRLTATLDPRVAPWKMFAEHFRHPWRPFDRSRTDQWTAGGVVSRPPWLGVVAVADNPQWARDGRWRPAWPNHHRVASSCPSWWWRPPRLEQVW